ncbi:unnamed protein product [Moneuplotes crassus]|uniref:Uncharacterized protein n=1 Tax=Euplotes crassus TaxID=5936 RepID=A0AAD1UDT7_EUPCR|nr:unnamed protein product [Moneuplotes crassus]
MDNKTSDFLKRFKGKISKIDKNGHAGVALKSFKPIRKNRRRLKEESIPERRLSQCVQNRRNKSLGLIKAGLEKHKIFQENLAKNSGKINDYGRNKENSLTPDYTRKSAKASISQMRSQINESQSTRKPIHRRINLGEIGSMSLKSIREKGTSYSTTKTLGVNHNTSTLTGQQNIKLSKKVKLYGNIQPKTELMREKAIKNIRGFRRSLKLSNSIAGNHLDSTNCSDNTGDYAIYKVTYDKNSTTVTEMDDFGISLTEAHGTLNPLMRKSQSISCTNRRRNPRHNPENSEILPLIHKFRRAMNSPRLGGDSETLRLGRNLTILS